MNAALLEPAAIEVERPELAAPGVIEIKPADKITNIAQLPSIWKLEQNIEWLVEGLIPLRSINLLTAESGTGKTWVAHAIAGAVADDRDFIGCKVKQKPALYLDGENPLAIVRRNLSELGIAETDNLKIWGGWNVEPPPGPDDERVVNFAKKECGLILFDSLVEFNPGDEQSSTETRAFMKKIRLLANLGATVVMLHNAGKSKTAKQYRGSSDIKAAVDTAYFVEGQPRSGRIHRMRLENYKSRFAPGQDFAMEFLSGLGFIPLGVPKTINPPSADEVVEAIVKQHPGLNGTQIKKLARQRGISKRKVDQCLGRGRYEMVPGKGNSTHYTIFEETAAAESEIPISPAPKREENREIEPSLLR